MMKWDSTVASHAQAWADTCPGSTHSDSSARFGTYDGENMAQAAGSNFVLTANTNLNGSVQAWYDEISEAGDYKDGGTFTGFGVCSGTCGHYTQVVWASADALGCGVAACTLMGYDGYHLVCQYHATVSGTYGGNMGQQTIFTKGTACGNCPSDYQTCTDSLCSDGTSASTTITATTATTTSSSDSTTIQGKKKRKNSSSTTTTTTTTTTSSKKKKKRKSSSSTTT